MPTANTGVIIGDPEFGKSYEMQRFRAMIEMSVMAQKEFLKERQLKSTITTHPAPTS